MKARDATPHLFRAVASHPAGVRAALAKVEENGGPVLQDELDAYLENLDPADVAAALSDSRFQNMHQGSSALDREARLLVARRLLQTAVKQERLEMLRSQGNGLPSPYCHDGFRDLDIDADFMVRLSSLEFDGSRYSYADSSALMLATTGAPNSTYWLAQHLDALGTPDDVRVRLDPLLWGPTDDFPRMIYMMRVYGQPLDWDRIGRLRDMEHGRWVADSPLSQGEITEYVWSPRGSEIHFEVEEMPEQIDDGLVSSRYVHAIYDPKNKIIRHVDGAIRVYSAPQQRSRRSTHLAYAGKDGTRAKVFRVDGEVPVADFSNIVTSFFVWNHDVQAYFDGKSAPVVQPDPVKEDAD